MALRSSTVAGRALTIFALLVAPYARYDTAAQITIRTPGDACEAFGQLAEIPYVDTRPWVGHFTLSGTGDYSIPPFHDFVDHTRQSMSGTLRMPGLIYNGFTHDVRGGGVAEITSVSVGDFTQLFHDNGDVDTTTFTGGVPGNGAFTVTMDGDCSAHSMMLSFTTMVTKTNEEGSEPFPFLVGPITLSFTGGMRPVANGIFNGVATFTALNVRGQPATWTVSWQLAPEGPPCRVQSVAWQESSAPLDENPGPGGGVRFFQERSSPDDPDPVKTVDIVVQTNRPNCLVYLGAFDVDNPSSDEAPIDPNGAEGNDNRGGSVIVLPPLSLRGDRGLTARAPAVTASAAAATTVLFTDGAGRATASFRPTGQPGDNFRVAATTDVEYLEGIQVAGIELADASGNQLPTDDAQVTLMASGWRTLNIEFDHMGPVVGNVKTGVVASLRTSPIPGAPVVLTLDRTYPERHYEGGRIVLNGNCPGRILTNRGRTVTLARFDPCYRTGTYELYDDDDMHPENNGFAKRGDLGEVPSTLDLGLVQTTSVPTRNIFAPASVVPRLLPAVENSRTQTRFELNWPVLASVTYDFSLVDHLIHFDNSGRSSPAFWVVNLLAAYQPAVSVDNDPRGGVSETRPVGMVMGQAYDRHGVALVFKETASAHEVASLGGAPIRGHNAERVTVAHEITHLLGESECTGGIMGDRDPAFPDATVCDIVDPSLTPDQVDRIYRLVIPFNPW